MEVGAMTMRKANSHSQSAPLAKPPPPRGPEGAATGGGGSSSVATRQLQPSKLRPRQETLEASAKIQALMENQAKHPLECRDPLSSPQKQRPVAPEGGGSVVGESQKTTTTTTAVVKKKSMLSTSHSRDGRVSSAELPSMNKQGTWRRASSESGIKVAQPNNSADSPEGSKGDSDEKTSASAVEKPVSAPTNSSSGRLIHCQSVPAMAEAVHREALQRASSAMVKSTVTNAFSGAILSSSMLWNRLSLGRKSPADILVEKHRVATKLQAMFRSARERVEFREKQRIQADKNAAEMERKSRAASMLQRLFRARRARFLLREALLIVFEKRIDPRTGAEFYYNRRTGQSQWEAPVLVKALIKDGDISKPILTPRSSAIRIQAVFRKSRVRAHMKELVESVWDRMYDPHSGHCYYMNKVTGEARWNKPVLLGGEDIEYKPQRRPGVEEYLSTQQKVVSQLWDEEALVAAKLIFGKPVRFMRLSLQEMRAQSTAIVAGDMGEVIEGGSEFDSVIVMTDVAVRGAMSMKVQQALNPMRFRIFTSYAPKRVFGKADRGNWKDRQEFFAFYKTQPTTSEFGVYWKRNDPATSCSLFRISREKLTDWQWKKIFAFHAFGAIPVHVFESGNRTRGTLLLTGTYAPEPPDEQWAYQFTFYAMEKAVPGTTIVNVQTKHLNQNPRNSYCRMTTMRAGTDGCVSVLPALFAPDHIFEPI
eukprot:INCI2563.2.p1 GENE.INCI2563.2~~INCI2563.2.p1  ORF type:complete len:707 (-),score=120.91 INCI2563.2:400-2520(-)